MIRTTRILTLGLLALAMNTIGTAYGQYQVTGTTPGGGNVVTGDGGALGSIISGDGILSAGGFDNVTFNAGSVAIGSGVDTVVFTTQGNTVISIGAISADAGANSIFYTNGNSQTVVVVAPGQLLGGAGAPDTGSGGGAGGSGIFLNTPNGSAGFSITNNNLISGGAGAGSVTNNQSSGYGGSAILLESSEAMTGFSLNNLGLVTGGAGGSTSNNNASGGGGGDGLALFSGIRIQNSNIQSYGGIISGGSAGTFGKNQNGNEGGSGIVIFATSPNGQITGITIISGSGASVLGGNGGSTAVATGNDGGDGGQGITLQSGSLGITNVSVQNIVSTIKGGDGGSSGNNHTGGDGGTGIVFGTLGNIDGVTIVNRFSEILGGNGAHGINTKAAGGNANGAIIMSAQGDIKNVVVNNSLSANIYGGLGGDGAVNADSGDGGAGVNFSALGVLQNITIHSDFLLSGGGGGGTISGNDKSNGGEGGAGVNLASNTGIINLHVYNGGIFSGGNGGVGGKNAFSGNGAAAINLAALGNIAGTRIENIGDINGGYGGNGFSDKVTAGFGGSGIQISLTGELTDTRIINTFEIGGGGGGFAWFNSSTGIGGSGISVAADGNLSGFEVQNSGLIFGGDGGFANDNQTAGAAGGLGIVFNSTNNLSGISILNTSTARIDGGKGGAGSKNNDSGDGALAISLTSSVVNGFTLQNAGVVRGGDGGVSSAANSVGGIGGGAIQVNTTSDIAGTSILNLSTGNIRGGNAGASGNNSVGSEGGTALSFSTDGGIDGFTLQNAGRIRGGRGRNGDDAANLAGGSGGGGITLSAQQLIRNVSIFNSGSIRSGRNANQAGSSAALAMRSLAGYDTISIINTGLIKSEDAGFSNNFTGGHGGNAIELLTKGSFNGLTFSNSGTILGSNGGGTGVTTSSGEGGAAFAMSAQSFTNSVFYNIGLMKGGNAGTAADPNGGDFGGNGLDIEVDTATNVGIVNGPGGSIIGGDGFGIGNTGGSGVRLETNNAGSTNFKFTNFGSVRGGAGNAGSTSGIGITLVGENVTIQNWGDISTGADSQAIKINGANNTVILSGYSTVHGKIEGNPPSSNNVLVLNFSGLSPAAQAVLIAQITSQGNLDNFTGVFTVRGLVYDVDPMVIQFNLQSYQLLGLTPNEQSLGAALDSLLVNPTGDLLNMLNAIDQSGNIPLALDQLSPQRYQIYGDIALQNANFNSLQIDQRLNNLRDGSESVDTTGMGGTSDATVLGFSKDDKGKDTVSNIVPLDDRRWGFFGSGNLGVVNIEGRAQDVTTSSRFTSAGMVMGLDGKINDKWVVGTMFHFVNTSARLDAFGGTADIDSIGGGLYAGYHDGPVYANGLLTYTHNDYDAQRAIAIPGFSRFAASNTDGDQFSGNIDGGYDFKLSDCVTVGPIAGLQYVHLGVNGFSETGAGAANLTVGDHDVDSLRSKLGIRIDFHKRINSEFTLAVEGRAQWQHEFLDDSEGITSSFTGAGLSPFTVQTSAPERDAALVGIGANVTIRNRLTIFVDYDAQIGQASYLEQSVRAGLKLSW